MRSAGGACAVALPGAAAPCVACALVTRFCLENYQGGMSLMAAKRMVRMPEALAQDAVRVVNDFATILLHKS